MLFVCLFVVVSTCQAGLPKGASRLEVAFGLFVLFCVVFRRCLFVLILLIRTSVVQARWPGIRLSQIAVNDTIHTGRS